jgi:hypothetical protein
MREASVQAQRQLASISNAARLDSLWVMEEAMSYFYRRAMTESSRSAGNCNQVRDDLLQAVAIAKEIALYRHPRLSAVKVSAIPSGPDWPGGNRGPAVLRIKLPKPFIQFRKRTVHQLANTPQRVLLRHPRLNIDIRKQ